MKSVFVHGVLALVGLLLSYQTWTRKDEEEQAPGQITILECEPSQLTSLEIETPSHKVSVAPKKSADKPEYWITTQKKANPKKPEDKKPDDKKPEDKKPEDKKPEEPKQARPYDAEAPVNFLASTSFDALLKSLAPLRALRDLGQLPKGKEAQFGFDKVGTFVRMECGGRKLALEVGASTFGAGDSYVRDAKTKRAYLINGQVLLDLQSAQFKFVHTDLHDFALADVDEAVIEARGQSKRLIQRNRAVKAEARWVDAMTPDTRNEMFGTWFQRVGRLKVKAFLGEGKQPGSDLNVAATATQPALTIEYKLEGKHKDKLEIVRVDTPAGNFYYARSEATRRWTSLYDSVAKQVEDDVALVVGAEEAPTPKTAPAVMRPNAPAPTTSGALPPGHPAVPSSHP